MGLYDRDYARDEDDEPRRSFFSGWSALAIIILINFLVFFVQLADSNFTRMLWLDPQKMGNPLQWYRLLTAAFAHDPNGFMHIGSNMLMLFFMGRIVEKQLGSKEFAIFYLVAGVVGNVVFTLLHFNTKIPCLGASGAVTAVIILFALKNPRVMLYFYGVIPVPAWLAGIAYVIMDTMGLFRGGNVAHDVHLSGAAFAAIYFFAHIKFTKLFTKIASSATGNDLRKRSRTGYNAVKPNDSLLNAKVDEILRKLNQYGEESLTEMERETLRYASSEYQKRRKNQ